MRLRYVKAASTQLAVERMLRGLGAAGGVDALFSVEWFVGTATAGQGALEASALWCASRVYEGIVGVVLKEFSIPSESRGVRMGADGGINKMNVEERRRVEKTARQLVRTISEFWDTLEREEMARQTSNTSDSLALYGDSRLPTEHVKGLDPLITLLDVGNKRQLSISTGTEKSDAEGREMARLHAALALQTLSISSSALGSRFPPLLLHAIYPILRSLVSSNNFLSSTAMAALHHVTAASAYAAPANLLLSNFDYALDSASRRLFRSRLDLKATKVLVILIRLVGKDVVQRAGDVVEECFDRLDEFHGYSNIVEGLVEVLSEIVKVVEAEEGPIERTRPNAWGGAQATAPEAKSGTAAFTEWYNQRKVDKLTEEIPEDFGPAPQRPWGREPSVDEDPAPKDPPSDDTPKPSTTQTLISKIIRRCLPVFASPQERHWVRNDMTWDIAVKCRRFLSASANKELQATARTLYQNLGRKNNDLVWLVLCATCGSDPRQPGDHAPEGSGNIADTLDNLREFLTKNDREHYGTVSDAEQRTSSLHDILSSSAHISIINHFETIEGLHNHLEDINILDQERLRPSWDSYFMTLSELAAQRSNCMKRRVGAILVRKNRILATG
ncbi:hypothetical protein FRC01_003689 [Tulasnella sp. 417]|nr:hypothetical protein FRC01_003689 [Tulasnella sp. 417]